LKNLNHPVSLFIRTKSSAYSVLFVDELNDYSFRNKDHAEFSGCLNCIQIQNNPIDLLCEANSETE